MSSNVSFVRATKTQSRLRMAIDGPSGSGKTYTALVFGTALVNGSKLAVIDTERGSASKYADMFEFDVLELDVYSPDNYIAGIQAAEDAGYTVLVIDSLSHAWEGKGGVLEMHDDATKRSRSGNSYIAWRDVTPAHRSLVDAILQSKCHVIATMRSKMDYIQTENDKGRKEIKRVGMAPVQRQGMEYEFDIVADMDVDHNMVVSKSRCFAIADMVVSKPTAQWFEVVRGWLTDGTPAPKPKPENIMSPEAKRERDDAPPASMVRRGNGGSKPAAVGWATWSDNAHKAFWAKANEMNLSDDGIHHEFGVESMKEYVGSMHDARALLDILDYGINKVAVGLQGIWAALGVAAVHEWKGSPQEATAAIDTWTETQAVGIQEQGELV